MAFDAKGAWLFAIWLASLVGLIALAIYDIRWMLLPNKIVFPVTLLAVLEVAADLSFSEKPPHVLLMALASLAIAGGLFYILFQVSRGRWIGGGDVKLGFALGLLLGHPSQAFLMLFFASLLGLAFSLPVVLFKRSAISQKVPFGPFLIVATIIVKLFGPHIIDWYSRTFLYL
jgi:prepilin signal peptidase PulO-like enzyme (type II secretory pathway)